MKLRLKNSAKELPKKSIEKDSVPIKIKKHPRATSPQERTGGKFRTTRNKTADSSEERIQKFLANHGVASRRQIEEWIKMGRIQINDEVATLGSKVTERDVIKIDYKIFKPRIKQNKIKVLVYHKPAGEICSRADEKDRPTVFDNLPKLRNQRWIMIGRLDFNTEGLLLFTNHGELAHRLMHPSYEIEREYAVRILGKVEKEMLNRLKQGILLEDGLAKFNEIIDAGGEGVNHWFHVTLNEGRNREVRRLWESQGVKVSRLIRVRFGAIGLPRLLKRGMIRFLEPEEVEVLANSVGIN